MEKAGALRDAARVGEEARAADLADRFLNSVCVRRLLQCGEHEEAEKTVALFTRDGDQASNLYDMQCAWFENYAGRCHAAAGRRGRALKYFQAVKTHYDDMEEDQFDFHQYCLRKMTLRSYVEMLRVEDALYARAAYREAAKGGIETYVDLHDKPLADEEAAEEAMLAAMTSDARKQYRKEKRKTEEKEAKIREAKKREEERELKKAADAAAKEGKKRKPTPKKEDPDPNGEKLARTKTPLDDAAKLLEPLLRHAGGAPRDARARVRGVRAQREAPEGVARGERRARGRAGVVRSGALGRAARAARRGAPSAPRGGRRSRRRDGDRDARRRARRVRRGRRESHGREERDGVRGGHGEARGVAVGSRGGGGGDRGGGRRRRYSLRRGGGVVRRRRRVASGVRRRAGCV